VLPVNEPIDAVEMQEWQPLFDVQTNGNIPALYIGGTRSTGDVGTSKVVRDDEETQGNTYERNTHIVHQTFDIWLVSLYKAKQGHKPH
jgi:hypothetical protein